MISGFYSWRSDTSALGQESESPRQYAAIASFRRFRRAFFRPDSIAFDRAFFAWDRIDGAPVCFLPILHGFDFVGRGFPMVSGRLICVGVFCIFPRCPQRRSGRASSHRNPTGPTSCGWTTAMSGTVQLGVGVYRAHVGAITHAFSGNKTSYSSPVSSRRSWSRRSQNARRAAPSLSVKSSR